MGNSGSCTSAILILHQIALAEAAQVSNVPVNLPRKERKEPQLARTATGLNCACTIELNVGFCYYFCPKGVHPARAWWLQQFRPVQLLFSLLLQWLLFSAALAVLEPQELKSGPTSTNMYVQHVVLELHCCMWAKFPFSSCGLNGNKCFLVTFPPV